MDFKFKQTDYEKLYEKTINDNLPDYASILTKILIKIDSIKEDIELLGKENTILLEIL